MDLTYATYFSQRSGLLSTQELRSFVSVLQKAQAGEDLSKAVVDATDRIVAAHSALRKAIEENSGFKGRLSEIQSLSDQVKAAMDLKKKLDQS